MSAPTPPPVVPGMVSVVLVNYRGTDDTLVCARSLAEQDWPAERLEVIVVENHSGDGSAERLRAGLPDARVVEAGANLGFAGGCNLGVAHARGEYVAFLNNDARADTSWVSAAVAALEADREVACVASKVLDWDGKLVDFVDGSLTWYGMGYKREVEKPDSPAYDEPKDVLFGTGAAMFVRTEVFRAVGGFDERFFMFYEDVDLGWRLNMLGHRVRYVPGSLAFHKHHASMKKHGNFRESYLLERNALMSMVKNYDDETLARTLPAALALAVRRSFERGGVDTAQLDLQRSPGGDEVGTLDVPKSTMAGLMAVDGVLEHLPSLLETRRELQTRRRRGDRELFGLFRQAIEPAYGLPGYLATHDLLVDALGIEQHFRSRQRVLVVTGEPLAERMAGPAIRAWEIARALHRDHDVVLASTGGVMRSDAPFRLEHASGGKALRALTDWADVIVFQGFLIEAAPWLIDSAKILVADVYDPMHLEQLEQARDLGEDGRRRAVSDITQVLNTQLQRADYLLCASAKQRDFWLGQLAGQGRVNPLVYDADESLRSLIDVVPFGVEDAPPVQRRHAIRGAVDGIGPDDKVVLWGGGIYNWFDPLTLIRAIDVLRREHPDVRLFFLGLKHPNPGVPDMRIAWETRQLADSLGLTGTHVFFNEGWVPYDERADYLLDADVGVSTHFHHIETEFSFRTRILDYLWASLPIVATAGDTFEPIIRDNGLGRVVPPEDVDALAAALGEMLYDDEAAARARTAVGEFADTMRWARTLRPLVEFVRDARRAPDLAVVRSVTPPQRRRTDRPRPTVRQDLALARDYLRAGGVREVTRRATGRLRRVVGGAPPAE